MPASSMARLLAWMVKPMALTPCSLPKREVPTPTMAQVPLTLPMMVLHNGSSSRACSRLLDRHPERPPGGGLPLVERMVLAHGAHLLEAGCAGALLGLPFGGEATGANLLERFAHAALEVDVGEAHTARHRTVLAGVRMEVHLGDDFGVHGL